MYKFVNKIYPQKVALYALLIVGGISASFMSCSAPDLLVQKQDKRFNMNTTMTKKLFAIQTERPNISLPRNADGEETTTLSESVTYKNPEMAHGNEERVAKNSEFETNKVHSLNAVEVVAKATSTPEQDGKINVGFNIKVPKSYISPKWRVILQPKLLHNDSVIPLQKIVLNGQEFVEKQKADYEKYNEYMESLISPLKYDSVFVNQKGIRKDIKNRQEMYWKEYHKEWKRRMEFERWLAAKGSIDSHELAEDETARLKRYHFHARNAMIEANQMLIQGKDTTGVFEKHMQAYDKETVRILERQLGGSYDLDQIPKQFRDLYVNPKSPDDLENFVFTEKDSIEIAKHWYDFKKVVSNEMALARKDEIFAELVPFPYNANKSEVRVDSMVSTDQDFVYYFSQDYPVVPGLKRVRIVLDTKVQAIDRSGYTPAKADTLSFFIASIVQLADTSLIYSRKKLVRNLYDKKTVYTQYRPNSGSFDINYGSNYAEMSPVVEALRTYNDHGSFTMDSITLRVYTSLDGDFSKNADLTMDRAESITQYLEQEFSGEINIRNIVRQNFYGEDWRNLAKQIKESNLKNKDAILDMLVNAVQPDGTEDEIRRKFPNDYKIIKETMYPKLNRVDIEIDMHRTGQATNDSVSVEHRADYEEGLKLLMDREYWAAIEILKNYPDYNTALCLVAMGYNQQAEDLLKKLQKTDKTEYLYAVLTARMEREAEAITHLKNACEMNPSLAFRTALDPDINKLVKKYNMKHQLEGSMNESYNTEADSSETGEATSESSTEDNGAASEDSATASSDEE